MRATTADVARARNDNRREESALNAMIAQGKPTLEVRGLSKSFGHVQALDNVDFVVYPGEIIALVGDNGAGKSTITKIVSGMYSADDGELFVRGEKVSIRNPRDAERLGIATVYQDLAVVGSRDVPSNIFLGREFTHWGGIFVDRRKTFEEAGKLMAGLGITLPSLNVEVGELSGGQRQAVAIARALVRGRDLFIMDEPTASLGVAECEVVLRIMVELKERGASVIAISHNLQHVFAVADRIIVMRHGSVVGTRKKSDTALEEIFGLIVGSRAGQTSN